MAGTKQAFLRILGFLAGLFLLLSALSWLYRPRDNTEAQRIGNNHACGWLSEPVGSIDVFFLGSSEFYSAVCPPRIWEQSGITSYVVATSGQRLYDLDTNLERILRTRKPKLVVVDAYVVLIPTHWDEIVFDEISDLVPILKYHFNWDHTSLSYFASPVSYTHHEVRKGFRPKQSYQKNLKPDHMKKTRFRYPFRVQNRLYTEHIRALCREAGVDLLFLAIPSPVNWDGKHSNTMQDYAQETGVPFLDLNTITEELGIDGDRDYRDGGDHMNGFGSKKVSIYLARYLREQYGLESHLQDPAYEQWNVDYEEIYGVRPDGS